MVLKAADFINVVGRAFRMTPVLYDLFLLHFTKCPIASMMLLWLTDELQKAIQPEQGAPHEKAYIPFQQRASHKKAYIPFQQRASYKKAYIPFQQRASHKKAYIPFWQRVYWISRESAELMFTTILCREMITVKHKPADFLQRKTKGLAMREPSARWEPKFPTVDQSHINLTVRGRFYNIPQVW
jgi:hypothetical protein